MKVISNSVMRLVFAMASCSALSAQPVQKMSSEIKVQLNAYYDAVERADQQKAIQALSQLITLDPTFPHYYGARASILENMPGIPIDSILRDLDVAVQLDSTGTMWLTHRLDIRLQAETDAMRILAIQDMRKLLEQDTLSIPYFLEYIQFARTCDTASLQQLYQMAISTAFQQLSAQPDKAVNWYHLAQVYASIPNAIDSERLLLLLAAIDKAIEYDPAQATYYIMRGDIHYAYAQHYTKAAIDFETASTLSSSPKIYAKWAQALAAAQQKDKAKETLNTGLLLYPNNYTLQALLASL